MSHASDAALPRARRADPVARRPRRLAPAGRRRRAAAPPWRRLAPADARRRGEGSTPAPRPSRPARSPTARWSGAGCAARSRGCSGLVLVALLLLVARCSPTSSRRWTPRRGTWASRRPTRSPGTSPSRGLRGRARLAPPARGLPDRRERRVRPRHLPAAHRPRLRQPPRHRASSRRAGTTRFLGIPHEPPPVRHRRRLAAAPARHRQLRPRHPLARHRGLAHLARHRAGLDRAHHRHRHAGGDHLGLHRRRASTPGSSASSRSSSPSRSSPST